MRDRLVCGLCSESTQKRLLSEADLTLARTMGIAQNMEAAHKNAQALKGPERPVRRLEKLPREGGEVERKVICYIDPFRADSGYIRATKV